MLIDFKEVTLPTSNMACMFGTVWHDSLNFFGGHGESYLTAKS